MLVTLTYDVSCALLAGLGFSATVAGQYIARGGHFHTRAILTDATGVTVWSRGHRRLLGVVTRIFGMVTGSRGHRRLFGLVALAYSKPGGYFTLAQSAYERKTHLFCVCTDLY